jgi:hypothetical protein
MTYARAAPDEGPSGIFHASAARAAAAAVALGEDNPEAWLVTGELTFRLADLGEGRVDTTRAREALRQLECARLLARTAGNARLAQRADSSVALVNYYLSEQRIRR